VYNIHDLFCVGCLLIMCLVCRRDSNPQSQQANCRKPTP
jgi:hypothetical protein